MLVRVKTMFSPCSFAPGSACVVSYCQQRDAKTVQVSSVRCCDSVLVLSSPLRSSFWFGKQGSFQLGVSIRFFEASHISSQQAVACLSANITESEKATQNKESSKTTRTATQQGVIQTVAVPILRYGL